MKVNIKKLSETAIIPKRGSEYAAGYDLYADIPEKVIIRPQETVKISTGIAMEIPQFFFGAIFARSGLATKSDLAPANKVGVIDSDYRGPFIVALHNHGDEIREVMPGDRIAQLVLMPYMPIEFSEVEELSETVRGDGGFGHSGNN